MLDLIAEPLLNLFLFIWTANLLLRLGEMLHEKDEEEDAPKDEKQ